MKFNIIVKSDKTDKFSVRSSVREKSITVESILSDKENDFVAHNIKSIIEELDRMPQDSVIDLANLSVAVYTIDQLVSRRDYGYQNWSRYFKVYLPVSNLKVWNQMISKVQSALSFLTGDKWEIELRTRNSNKSKIGVQKQSAFKVSLFSGGLDSLIGAIDLIEKENNIALVSHHKGGGGGEKSTQELLVKELVKEYPNKKICSNLFYVQPIKDDDIFTGENTQRARSLLFMALGLLVANSHGATTSLIIPENALISLNIPLTTSRYGSYSTKTTHPNFVAMINEIILAVGINNKIDNPYRFMTKGEMMINCSNKSLLARIAYSSMSCSKTNYYKRWTKKTAGQKEIASHCGHCVPCIIRRSAFNKASMDEFKGNYVRDALKKSNQGYPDIRAFKIGLARFKKQTNLSIFDLFKGGIFQVNDSKEITNYLNVYKRGMDEVDTFFKG